MLNKPGFAWWLICNCTLAYAVNLTNFLVTKYTSALTLQVGGWVGGREGFKESLRHHRVGQAQ
jgi:hypothetical protein